jgi:energy-coupling factor transporter ATP-binding protein EcfA2
MDSPLLKLTEREDKTKALKNLLLELKKGDKAEDSIIAQRSGSFIVAVFSTAITIAGFSVMPPVIGGALIGACVASAGGTITALCSEFLHRKTSNKELLAVLTSKEVKQWVKLWELSSDTELFLTALEYACQGELIEINGREIFRHDDGKHPFDIAHQWIKDGINPDAKIATDKSALAPTQDTTVSHRVSASPAPVTPTSTKWINHFISQTALIWGNQGSGKSWMARYIAKLKKDKGYRVIVLDPDSNRAEWEGVESYHDFEEIAEFLGWYMEELKGRYKAFNASNMTEDAWRAKLWADGKALAVICEEVTTYVDLIEDKELLTQFFRLGLTKSRKQEMPLTFVSHNNTQSALGGIKGLASLIEKMLQLELQTNIDAETLQPVASGNGAVKLDGSNQWMPVILPKLERKITNFGEPQPTVVQQPVTAPQSIPEVEVKEEVIPSTESTIELKVSDSLGEPLKSIWLFAKKKGNWVTAKDIYKNGMTVLKESNIKQIRQYLGLLADTGYGEIDEMEGDKRKSDSSVGFRAY